MDRELARALMLSAAHGGWVMTRKQSKALAHWAEADIDEAFVAQLEQARDSRRRVDEANQAALHEAMLRAGLL